MRLIDADALIANKFKNDISYNAFKKLVERQPTIEAITIVRCKDCQWQRDCEESVGSEYFCADGERRDHETN